MKRLLFCVSCILSLMMSVSCAQPASERMSDASVEQSPQESDLQFAIRVVDKKGHGIMEASVCPTQQDMVKTTLDGYVYNCPLDKGQQILILCEGYKYALVTYSGPGMVVGLDRDYSKALKSVIVWLIIAAILVILFRMKAVPDKYMLVQVMLSGYSIGRLGRYLIFSWKLAVTYCVMMLIQSAVTIWAVKRSKQKREPDMHRTVVLTAFGHFWIIAVVAVSYFFFTTEKKPAFIIYFVLALAIAAIDIVKTLKRYELQSRDSAAGH